MKKMVITGGKTLTGEIKINGAKNSSVALLPAAILSDDTSTIYNVPDITDIDVLTKILVLLNCEVTKTNNSYKINTENIENATIPEEISKSLRASYYFMGALLTKFKHVEIYFPGGCNFGARQIDFHLKAFEDLGATIKEENNKFTIDAEKLIGTDINLKFPSVGATINIMLASVKAEGITTISNAAAEPEILNVAVFLNSMGAKITGAGTKKIKIEGVKKLSSGKVGVIPDRIETGTYIIAGALIGQNLKISNINSIHITALLNTLDKMGAKYLLDENSIVISKAENLKPVNIETEVYPGFPTDLAQPISVLLSKCDGISKVTENIYEKRMGHVKYLNAMGANIEIEDNKEVINGPIEFHGTDVEASDLRAGATLFLAALTAKEETTITNVEYILRGYEKIVNKLSSVGANIKLVEIK